MNILWHFSDGFNYLPNDVDNWAARFAQMDAAPHSFYLDAQRVSGSFAGQYDPNKMVGSPDIILGTGAIEAPARKAISQDCLFVAYLDSIKRFTPMEIALLDQRTNKIVVPSAYHAIRFEQTSGLGIEPTIIGLGIPANIDHEVSYDVYESPALSDRKDAIKIYWAHNLTDNIRIITALIQTLKNLWPKKDFIIFFDYRQQIPESFNALLRELQALGLRHHAHLLNRPSISAKAWSGFLNTIDVFLSLRSSDSTYPQEALISSYLWIPTIVIDNVFYQAILKDINNVKYTRQRREPEFWANDLGIMIQESLESEIIPNYLPKVNQTTSELVTLLESLVEQPN